MENAALVTEQTKRGLMRLRSAGLDAKTFRLEALQLLERAFSVDMSFFGTLDPTTLLLTGGLFTDDLLRNSTQALLENELLENDFNKFAWLARSNKLVASLSAATGQDMDRSQRYCEILKPRGLGDEIKAAVMVNASTWGCLCLHREHGAEAFTVVEVENLRKLIPVLAEGLRLALLGEHITTHDESPGPGLLILNDDLSIAGMNPAAEYWLANVAAVDWSYRHGLPFAVYASVLQLQALERDGFVSSNVRIPLRTAAGHWLILHASQFSGLNTTRQVSVILEVARPPEIAPLIQKAYGLTKREQEIVQCVAVGQSTAEISGQLQISENTVQDHLKSIFDKVGVRNRRSLVKQIFDDHYQPRWQTD